jgi:hypothetical protein
VPSAAVTSVGPLAWATGLVASAQSAAIPAKAPRARESAARYAGGRIFRSLVIGFPPAIWNGQSRSTSTGLSQKPDRNAENREWFPRGVLHAAESIDALRLIH